MENPNKECLYAALGVTSKATQQEIKTAYRKLQLKHHPDRTPGISATDAINNDNIIKSANEAYDVLSNSTTRAEYDNQCNREEQPDITDNIFMNAILRHIQRMDQQQQHPIFQTQSFFGHPLFNQHPHQHHPHQHHPHQHQQQPQHHPQHQPHPQQQPQHQHQQPIFFQHFFPEQFNNVFMTEPEQQPSKTDSYEEFLSEWMHTRPSHQSVDQSIQPDQPIHIVIDNDEVELSENDFTYEYMPDVNENNTVCPPDVNIKQHVVHISLAEAYKGGDIVVKDDTDTPYTIVIPPGVYSGFKYIVPNANIEVCVIVDDCNTFKRKDDDLFIEITISLKDALSGFNLNLKHPGGKEIRIKKTIVTEPEELLELNHLGMIESGKLYIRFHVSFMGITSVQSDEIVCILS
jgi:DnaJ-class molecular chaperone